MIFIWFVDKGFINIYISKLREEFEKLSQNHIIVPIPLCGKLLFFSIVWFYKTYVIGNYLIFACLG